MGFSFFYVQAQRTTRDCWYLSRMQLTHTIYYICQQNVFALLWSALTCTSRSQLLRQRESFVLLWSAVPYPSDLVPQYKGFVLLSVALSITPNLVYPYKSFIMLWGALPCGVALAFRHKFNYGLIENGHIQGSRKFGTSPSAVYSNSTEN